jgi:TolB-like protein
MTQIDSLPSTIFPDILRRFMKTSSSRLNFVTRTAAALSLAVICAGSSHAGDPLQGIAKFIAKNVNGTDGKKVAVMTFYYPDGAVSSGSSIIPERLTTYLVNMKGMQVIERSLLHQVLEEVEFQQIGAFDKTTAKRLGKFLGVDALVVGSLSDQPDHKTEVNARLVDAETGAILAAKNAVITRTWLDRPQIPPPPEPPAKKPEPPAKPSPEPEENPAPALPVPHLVISNPHPREPSPSPEEQAAPSPTYITINNPPPLDNVPLRNLPETPPENLNNNNPAQQYQVLQTARQVYVRSRVPQQRARALMMIGRIQEQRGDRAAARRTYSQVTTEFHQIKPIFKEAHRRFRSIQKPPPR